MFDEYLTETKILYSMVDSGMHVRLTSIAKIIEDSTTEFLSQHNLSGKELNHMYGAIMVVLRNHIFFNERIHFKDTIVSKVSIVRKASVAIVLKTELFRKNENNPLVTSYIQLSAIDMVTRRLRNLEDFKQFHEMPCNIENSVKGLFNKYPLTENDFSLSKEIDVQSTDIDYSNHLNNIAYLNYFLSCLPSKEIRHLPYKELEVNYIKEAKEGSRPTILYRKEEKDLYFILKHNGEILTKARIVLY